MRNLSPRRSFPKTDPKRLNFQTLQTTAARNGNGGTDVS